MDMSFCVDGFCRVRGPECDADDDIILSITALRCVSRVDCKEQYQNQRNLKKKAGFVRHKLKQNEVLLSLSSS